MKHPFEEEPMEFYEYLLLSTLTQMYLGRQKTNLEGFQKYSNLIIDKFAIHSSSFIHLSKGIIELKNTNEEVRISAYDLFTVNSVFRILMENYATFNHIFVEPKTNEEQKFRFLLWKIDGLFDKQQLDIQDTDFGAARNTLDSDAKILNQTIEEFENCSFYKQLDKKEIEKIYRLDKKRFSWRFSIIENKITPLKIYDLIKHTCKTRGFINMYKYTSIHTHTNYLALEHFEQTRSKPISPDYTNPITKLAIYLTCLFIFDLVSIDNNVKIEFEKQPKEVINYINGISKSIKNE